MANTMTGKKEQFQRRLESLRSDRSSFIDYWKELSENILSYRGRFLVTDYNKGHKRNTKQINNTPRKAARTLASGMMAGITSPARPWFRLATPYPELNNVNAVREWLYDVEVLMREVFAQSNLYNSLHTLYGELGTFGIGSLGIFEDFDNVIRCKPYTVGSYMFGMNGKNVVDTMYREFQYTVAQVVDEYGLENCSQKVKQAYERRNLEIQIDIVHAVEPNPDHREDNPMAKYKRYRSCYYEKSTAGKGNEADLFLRESGFDSFPIMAPRWDATGEDVYGTDCPGMMSLGDIKALQLYERRKAQAIDKVANPPTQAPVSLRNAMSKGGIAAGEITWVNSTADGGIKSIYDYRPDIGAIQNSIQEIEQRVGESFYEDLFLMLSQTDRRQITAREIQERHEEKLLMLGPVLERLHSELLDPLIDRTFTIMQKAGMLPPPPDEIQDIELKVEYVSVLAQAQRMVAVGGIERLAGFVGEMAQIFPDVRYKFDAEQAVDEYADSMGISPRIVRGDDEVAKMKQQAAEQQQQQQQMEMAQQAAQMGRDVSQIDTGGKNPIADFVRQQTGV